MEHSKRIENFFADFPYYVSDGYDDSKERITQAWNFVSSRRAEEKTPTGKSVLDHPFRVASILAELKMDPDSIICALLHGKIDQLPYTIEEVEKEFGSSISLLLINTTKISDIRLYHKVSSQSETVCKMFISMVDDLRVMIIRLADRLDKMNNLFDYAEERQKEIAAETIEVWAPLAQRLGMSTIHHELEDLGLKYSNREAFDQIKTMVASKKYAREEFLLHAEKNIYKTMSKAEITVKVQKRAKHFWSIYQKLKKRNKAVDEIYDLLAVRILCSTINECYTILGLVHTIWKPLEGRFKDYIAMPKANGYQSLHTSVLCNEGQPLEIQIRTYQMHEVAERGIASHWVYKKNDKRHKSNDSELSFVRQLKELSQKKFNDEEFIAELKNDLLGDSIFVFTPRGDIIELPDGSTAIDFAYTIHSAIGEKIVSAKADGSIIPLSRPLKNTQVVEVITHPNAHPTRNQYENAHTTKARSKIRGWLQLHSEMGSSTSIDKGDKLQKAPPPPPKSEKKESASDPNATVLHIKVGGSSNFMVKFAHCCNPTPSDTICGYVSRGRGVIIHKIDCSNLAKIPEIESRIIEVEWDVPKEPVVVKKKK